MCIGVPMKLIEVNYPAGIAEAKGVKRQIGLHLLPEESVKVGDHVIVHVGYAIEKIDSALAEEIWKTLDQLIEQMEEEEGARGIHSNGHG